MGMLKLFIFFLNLFAEITAFSDRYEEFSKINTEILGVSIDSVVHSLFYLFNDVYAQAVVTLMNSTFFLCTDNLNVLILMEKPCAWLSL